MSKPQYSRAFGYFLGHKGYRSVEEYYNRGKKIQESDFIKIQDAINTSDKKMAYSLVKKYNIPMYNVNKLELHFDLETDSTEVAAS
jgi:hypothetical protein